LQKSIQGSADNPKWLLLRYPSWQFFVEYPLNIRKATAVDALAVEALYRQLVAADNVQVSGERIEQVARDPNTVLLVVEEDGVVHATALVSLCSDVMYGTQPFAVVENVVVDLAYRSVGMGRTLFASIEQLCVERDCSKIMLLSSATRADAHRFFEGVGLRGNTKRGFVKYCREFAKIEPA
jgi:N-acetylglutamate synthase-like GNAT family acetyltransferase